jgi:hypothetical protein
MIDLKAIREISWAGIPDAFRATVWRLFLDYEPVNAPTRAATLRQKRLFYFDCLKRIYGEDQQRLWTNAQRETQSQICRDLPRTPIVLLRNERVQLIFERVLFVWSVRHPASGYVQGMNDVLRPFFFAFLAPHLPDCDLKQILERPDLHSVPENLLNEVEADCFWCFSKLLDGLQDCFTKDQPGIYKMLNTLVHVVERVEPRLAEWISQEEISYDEFAFRWMNCLLVREFPVGLLFRLWDLYLSNHLRITATHVYFCAALLSTLSPRLVGISHSDFLTMFQELEPESWSIADMEVMIAQSYVYEKMFAASPSHLRSPSTPVFKH